ncbi:MAG: hypothetical protein DMF94_07765 [Acidobacteria bacterium]|nr:MAG: hypothetical protein DMF94_07765 [Acidobacteriota bacterium]
MGLLQDINEVLPCMFDVRSSSRVGKARHDVSADMMPADCRAGTLSPQAMNVNRAITEEP